MKKQSQHPLFFQFLGQLLDTAGKAYHAADHYIASKIPSPPNLLGDTAPTPMAKPTVSLTPTPTQNPAVIPSGVLSPEQIKAGLLKFNPNTPLASQSGVLSQAMGELAKQGKIDPYLVLVKALAESRGGLDLKHPTRQLGGAYEGINNPYNMKDTTRPGKFVNYPDYKTAVLGGWNPNYNRESLGFVGTVLKSPYYEKYRQTGDINDFNSVYTPSSDNNPTPPVLGDQMQKLKGYFQ